MRQQEDARLTKESSGLSETDLTSLCLDFRERKFIVGDHGAGVVHQFFWGYRQIFPLTYQLGAEGNIHVYDYLNGSRMKSFEYSENDGKAHFSEVSRLCYCVEHLTVISVSWDCSISIHDESDPERGILLRRMTVSSRSV